MVKTEDCGRSSFLGAVGPPDNQMYDIISQHLSPGLTESHAGEVKSLLNGGTRTCLQRCWGL